MNFIFLFDNQNWQSSDLWSVSYFELYFLALIFACFVWFYLVFFLPAVWSVFIFFPILCLFFAISQAKSGEIQCAIFQRSQTGLLGGSSQLVSIYLETPIYTSFRPFGRGPATPGICIYDINITCVYIRYICLVAFHIHKGFFLLLSMCFLYKLHFFNPNKLRLFRVFSNKTYHQNKNWEVPKKYLGDTPKNSPFFFMNTKTPTVPALVYGCFQK